MFSFSAKYLYVEASGHSNDVAKLDSKEYAGGHYCLQFYYHMYGANTGNIKLNAVFVHNHKAYSTHTLRTWTGDQGDAWKAITMNLNIQTNSQWKVSNEHLSQCKRIVGR